jgi:hypothetical protein
MKQKKSLALRMAHWATCRRLRIITCRNSIHSVPPKVGSQFSQRESRIRRYQLLAQLLTRLAPDARAQIKVLDRSTDSSRQIGALCRLRGLEERSEIHWASFVGIGEPIVYQFALLRQDFLHVYHFDSSR